MKRLAALFLALLLSGCTASSAVFSPTDPPTAEGYTAEEIYAYFCETAFESEYGGERGFICKWAQPVAYFLKGEFGDGETAVLDDLCRQLNEIPGFPGIRRTEEEEEANLTVHFVMQNELSAVFGDEAAASSGMSRFYYLRSRGEILRAEAGIATNIIPQSAKASVICEEFLQSMGLAADSYSYPESVFYEGYNASIRPAPIDWAVVSLLYSTRIAPGTEREAAEAAARQILGLTETEEERSEG